MLHPNGNSAHSAGCILASPQDIKSARPVSHHRNRLAEFVYPYYHSVDNFYLTHSFVGVNAAGHSTRHRLMEAATQNAKRLIDELTVSVQSARRQAITEEMQTLVAGAGLIGTD